ncbi:MAG: eukaryotic-like serine/threonine-protein kinase, partial [Microbacteriaceae bacterium]|nr:eukaryotic-like serine/threonine-protein kinase [Microbacteriaceae bacterium]
RALSKDRFDRYQSAAEFREEVESAGAGHVPVHKPRDAFADTLFGTPPSVVSGPEAALRQLANDETMVRTQRRPPVIWVWAGIAAVTVIVIAVLFWVFRLTPNNQLPATSRAVPSLAGQVFDKARLQLENDKLKWTRLDEASSTVATGNVTRTDPAAGIIVSTGDTITIYVSTGKKAATVTDVHNMPLADAQNALKAAGFVPGLVNTTNDPTVPANVVLSTTPAAGSSAHEGDTISLNVSSGNVTLPDLTQQSVQAATGILAGLQLKSNPQPDPTCPTTPGTMVNSQSVAPGDVPQGSVVTFTYCTG